MFASPFSNSGKPDPPHPNTQMLCINFSGPLGRTISQNCLFPSFTQMTSLLKPPYLMTGQLPYQNLPYTCTGGPFTSQAPTSHTRESCSFIHSSSWALMWYPKPFSRKPIFTLFNLIPHTSGLFCAPWSLIATPGCPSMFLPF